MKRVNKDGAYWVMMRAYDKQTCEWGLQMCHGSVRVAAELLGINVGFLHRKIGELGIDVKQFRNATDDSEAAET